MVVHRRKRGDVVLSKSTSAGEKRRPARKRATHMQVLVFLLITVLGFFYLSYHMSHGVAMENTKQQAESHHIVPGRQPEMPLKTEANKSIDFEKKNGSSSSQINHDKCAFRSYPSNRLYGLSSESPPKFLSEAAYIRGQLPIIINSNENDNKVMPGGHSIQQTPPMKVCLDTTSWDDLVDENGKERLPFTDGHNPSVISLAPNPYQSNHQRLDPTHLAPIASAVPSMSLSSLFLAVSCFGSGQCKFGLSPEDVDAYRFSLHEQPPGGKRAMIAVLAPPNINGSHDDSSNQQSPFQTIMQTTLLLERDVSYGTRRQTAIQPKNTGTGFERIHQEFDDPRLFFHLGRVWVLYRNGPLFGYTAQIHNPIHFEKVSPGENTMKFVAYVKASETVRVDGGRNIALISEEPIGKNEKGELDWVPNPSLKALTWVDPVTVRDDIDLGDIDTKLKHRRLLEVKNESALEYSHQTRHHRRLGSKPTKSHIHGTNGYMVPLPSTSELLGMAHFHRPEDRKSSEHALHGHHYTHALFTIARQAPGDDTKSPRPFKLKRISNEFVFRSNSRPAGETQLPSDGDIIQFASGVDVMGSDIDGRLIISYGINDCEGGVFTLSMETVQKMLIKVEPGQEVVDLMEYIQG